MSKVIWQSVLFKLQSTLLCWTVPKEICLIRHLEERTIHVSRLYQAEFSNYSPVPSMQWKWVDQTYFVSLALGHFPMQGFILFTFHIDCSIMDSVSINMNIPIHFIVIFIIISNIIVSLSGCYFLGCWQREFVNLEGWKPTLILTDEVTLLSWYILCELLDSILRGQLFLNFLLLGQWHPLLYPFFFPCEQDFQPSNLEVFYI